ncbi:MAG: hypothetical protein ACRD3K_03865, partial [Edaphobacter sp.]
MDVSEIKNWRTKGHNLCARHRTVGIWGDSLTFLGGLLLSAEALFKKKDRFTLASIATVVKLFPGAEDGKGNKLTTTTEEDKQLKRWETVAKWGVGLLTFGFLLL